MADVNVTKIPFVDGLPSSSGDQLSINWIKNGEQLNGSTSNTGDDGQLNRVPVQLQKNIITLENNQGNIVSAVNQNTDDLDSIKEALGTSAGSTVAGRVTVNEQDIALLQTAISNNDTDISTNKTDITSIKTDIGTQGPEDTIYRTVRNDLLWIKQQVGNYTGYDIDGQISDQLGSSGMKGKITSLSDAVSSQNTRLTNLEDINEAYSISDISNDVLSIRNELGQSSNAPSNGVYASIIGINQSITANNTDIQTIKTAIDITNTNTISSRVTTLEGEMTGVLSDLNDTSKGLNVRVKNLETELGDTSTSGSIVSRLNTVESETNQLISSVGTDNTSGLLKRVDYIETKIGATADDQTPSSTSILGQLSTLNTETYNNTSNIQNIQVQLGDSKNGIIQEVNSNTSNISTLKTQMNGSGSGKGDLDDIGVYKYVQNINSNEIVDVTDNSLYVRTKGAWQQLSSSVAYMIYSGTVATTSTAVDLDLTSSTGQILNRATQVSGGIQIVDAGIYEIDVDLAINKSQASSSYVITINNGSPIESATTGVITNTGSQTIKLNTVTRLSAGAQIKLTLTSSVDQSTIIDYLRVKVKPLV